MHHSDEIKELQKAMAEQERLLTEEAQRMALGATGEFPEGKLTPDDEGELKFGVAVLRGKVVFNFGKPVAYFAMGPTQALELGNLLIERAKEAAAS